MTAVFLAVSAHCGNAAETDIDQIGQKFTKQTLALRRGDRINFLNRDDVTHNIHIIDSADNADDKGLQKPGQMIVAIFDKSGRFVVRCSIHPRMKMVVSVE